MNEIPESAVRDVLTKAETGDLSGKDFAAVIAKPLQGDLSPWELWTLIGLFRHERRQKWVGYIVETKLRGSGRDIGAAGALAHPEDVEQEGSVPDTPDWRYFFHGRGCCLTNTDGTSIDVDFGDDGSTNEIDPYFFGHFLTSLPKPEWSDAKLRYAPPLEDAWQYDLTRLEKLGLIVRQWRFRLTDEGRAFCERIEPIVEEINRLASCDSDTGRLRLGWLLASVGDCGDAKRALGPASDQIAALLGPTAIAAIEKRVATLGPASVLSRDETQSRLRLAALGALGREYVEGEIAQILQREPPSASHLLGLRIAESWNDQSITPMLIGTLRRFVPQRRWLAILLGNLVQDTDQIERLRNTLLVTAAKIILSNHSRTTIPPPTARLLKLVLREDRKAQDAVAGFLLCLLDSSAGITKLQANLQNRVPIAQKEAAIFLGMIGTKEALDVLVRAARGAPERGGHVAACALSMLNLPQAQAEADNWSRRNDGYEEAESREIEIGGRKVKTWNMDDMLRTSTRQFVADWSDQLNSEYGELLTRWNSGRNHRS